MLETLGLDMPVREAAFLVGGLIGLLFGALAEISRFCLRRGLVQGQDRAAALGTWLMALAAAIAGTQAAQVMGWIDLSGHRFLSGQVPALGIALGAAIFGVGMVLTRGCPARMTVLAATGNLRALLVLVVLAITATATLKGLLNPWFAAISRNTLALPHLDTLSHAAIWLPLLIAVLAIWLRPGFFGLVAGAAIGLLIPAGWIATGMVLLDDFDPIPLESLSFIAPTADTLFWAMAATAISPGFGVGLVLGTFVGAFAAATLGRRLAWQSFVAPGQTMRYLIGAVMMGFGGVLAGGCSIGAGLTGLSALSSSALLALVTIAVTAMITDRLLSAWSDGSV